MLGLMWVILAVILFGGVWRQYRFKRNNAALIAYRYDKLLHDKYVSLIERAQQELPPEQMQALSHEIVEIKQLENRLKNEGVNILQARRMVIEGAIGSINNHILLNELLPG